MSANSTRSERLDMINAILRDPVADLDLKESVVLVYHTIAYELYQVRINRLERRKREHGEHVRSAAIIANFKHQMQDI